MNQSYPPGLIEGIVNSRIQPKMLGSMNLRDIPRALEFCILILAPMLMDNLGLTYI